MAEHLRRPDLTHLMGRKHEEFIAKVLGGDTNPGSGNQWHSTGDGHDGEWGWDAKSTLAQSISVSIPMLDKLADQVYPRRPLLPLRFYANDRLTVYRDFVVVGIDDFVALRENSSL